MIRIAVCCGEGFSSGFLSRHLSQCLEREKLQEEASFTFTPLDLLERYQDDVDIAMIMPNMEWKAKKLEDTLHIPLYIIPFKVVVKPTAREYIDDAYDILELSGGKPGITYFEGEENTALVRRLTSHREWVKKNKKGR